MVMVLCNALETVYEEFRASEGGLGSVVASVYML